MSTELIRQVLVDRGRLAVDITELTDSTDLYSVGLTSHATVDVMLGLEDAFDVEFPDEYLRRSTFSSVANISSALADVQAT